MAGQDGVGDKRWDFSMRSHPTDPGVHERIATCPESGMFPRLGKLLTGMLYDLLNDIEEKCRELEDCSRMPGTSSSVVPDKDQPINKEIKRIKLELRELLLTYGQALSVCRDVAGLPDPSEYHHQHFHDVVKRYMPNGVLPAVYGSSEEAIDRDLCVHTAPPLMDPFSRMVIRLLKALSKKKRFERFFNNKSTREQGFMTRDVVRATHVITCVVVPLFFYASIAALYVVNSMAIRLAIIPAFLLVFAFAAIFLAGSTRNEMIIFMSAYAAVLVVFVSGNISSH